MFYNNANGILKNARIVDQDSKLQVARGKGSYFWGNARFEFVGGEGGSLLLDAAVNAINTQVSVMIPPCFSVIKSNLIESETMLEGE